MKKFISLGLVLVSLSAVAAEPAKSTFFQRPLSCPLRFSQMTTLRDQMQTLVGALGPECAKNGGQAISQLNSSMSNLEGIANSYKSLSSGNDAQSDAQYAKNVNQILGSLNVITSNTSCFYDIRSRGALPVISDIVMSISQFGLLVPSATGMAVAAGGYIVGSGLKIINELVKKRYNFNKPEERRAFLQLNCAFFDNRRTMEESGIFDLETPEYRSEVAQGLREEKAELARAQREQTNSLKVMEETLARTLRDAAEAQGKRLDPALSRKLETITLAMGNRPTDYADKWRQAVVLAREAQGLVNDLDQLVLGNDTDPLVQILRDNLARMLPELETGKRAFTVNIDDWEMHFRGPIMAFVGPINSSLKNEIAFLENQLALNSQKDAVNIAGLKNQIQLIQSGAWAITLRLRSLDSKIIKLQETSTGLFSDADEGTTNEVEILDYYRKLQTSILGREGEGYLENTIQNSYQLEAAVDAQVTIFDQAKTTLEKCAAAEKMRFAWSQYRFKVQEAHDFVSTNLDLYRSTFRIGRERQRRATTFVLSQIESVEKLRRNEAPGRRTVGELMSNAEIRVPLIEPRIHRSGCF